MVGTAFAVIPTYSQVTRPLGVPSGIGRELVSRKKTNLLVDEA
jgi:hypothetical protein